MELTQARATDHARSPGHTTALWGKVALYAVLAAMLVATITPFAWTALASFKLNNDIFKAPVTFWPRVWTGANYTNLLSGDSVPFIRQFINSCIITIGQTALAVTISALAGFGFAKYEFVGKKLLFILTLLTLMIPFEVTVVPLFNLMVKIGWLDTYWSVIVPGAVNAFGVFLMRQTMIAVPDELLDAARIDGATEFRILWQVVLPLTRGGLAVLALLSFLNAWNDYLWPLIALRSPDMFTLPIGLATLSGLYRIEWGMIMAGAVLTTLPVLVVFYFTRHHLVSGLAAGAVKG
jgi:ABC-type glycerol-3-phosphate transport system permease component